LNVPLDDIIFEEKINIEISHNTEEERKNYFYDSFIPNPNNHKQMEK
jgi:hypothetical protein